ncbi:MAG: sensor histidine kinase [Bacilli bacterium]|nr:sensor histidine kinase [Bacilli bacterium]
MFTFIVIPRVICAVEILLSELIFFVKLRKKKHFWLALSVTAFLMFAWAIFLPEFTASNTLLEILFGFVMFFPLWLFSLFGLFFMIDEHPRYVFLIGVAGYTVQKLGSLFNSCVTLINPSVLNLVELLHLSPWPFLSLAAVDAAVLLSCYFLFSRRMVRYQRLIISRNVYWISVIASLTNIGFGLVYTGVYKGSGEIVPVLLNYSQNILCCILVLLIVSGIFQRGAAEKELEFNKAMYCVSRENYKNEKATAEIINQKCHDMKHRVMELMQGSAMDCQDILEAIDIYDASIHTNNEALDIVVKNKRLLADQHGIRFNLMMDATKLSFMKNADVFTLFGNLFDNAITAVSKCEDEAEKEIYVKVFEKNNLLMIGFENRFNEKLNCVNGKFRTTNPNKENHGIGIASIEATVRKYDGAISMKAERKRFITQISFILK